MFAASRPRHAVHSILLLFGAALLWAPCAVVSASGLQVTPTTLDLAANEAATGLWLRNTGDKALHAQVRVYHWTQVNGEDKLTPSRRLVISPPMLQLQPGQSQLLRVIRTGAPPQNVEDAYRLIVNELPQPADEGGLTFVLRYSIPVFLSPRHADNVQPALQWVIDKSEGQTWLVVHNSGRGHAQISDPAWVDAGGHAHVLHDGLLGYVLPGESMRWPIAPTPSIVGTPIHAQVNGERVSTTLSPAADAR